MTSTLEDPNVVRTLDRLHADARGDWRHMFRVLPRVAWGVVTGRGLMQVLTPSSMARAYLPVTRDAGRLLYTLARATRAQHIVEFGASFGISTIYLGAAARDNGGTLVTTEIEASKCRVTEANLREAGLDDVVEVLEGDARETLARASTPIDMLFLDGWKDLYLPLLDQLRPRLERGALIVADNTNFRDAQPYVTHVRTPAHGFVSTTLAGGTMELSYLGS